MISLLVTRSTPTSKRNSARLDLLSTIMNSPSSQKKKKSSTASDSPRDSLSPLDDSARHDFLQFEQSSCDVELSRGNYPSDEAGSHEAQTEQEPHITFQESETQHEVATAPLSTEACSPRSPLITRDHRPFDLNLTGTHGLTTCSIGELKQQIREPSTATCATVTQVPHLRSKPLPKPSLPMGNKPSSVSGTPDIPDGASVHSVVRKPVRVLRKSSTNLLKRFDSKSPLPPALSTTTLPVQQQVSPTTDNDVRNENDEGTSDPLMDGAQLSKSPGVRAMHSASTVTITDENAWRPLSASTTIRDSRADSRRESRAGTRTSFIEDLSPEPQCQPEQLSHLPRDRSLALSPSIPAPSPLPEDSPHKYGLKDRMETPEMQEPEEINLVKARRRSSGLDIFNEAKSLQSASSFLNGLSTSRRRAESTQRSTETSGWTIASYDTTRPSTRPSSGYLPSRPSSTRPISNAPSTTYSRDRRRGHSFKPSGFAYTLPLTLAQMRCYRDHAHLLPSRNKTAPVECSVCHIDDEKEHFSCSWCALRMCRFCREDFTEHGMTALKERIKQAELGGSSSNSSTESLGAAVLGRRYG